MALGECGGDCAEDADADGIRDDVDDQVGELDACGVCKVQARSTSAVVRTSLRRLRLRWKPARRSWRVWR